MRNRKEFAWRNCVNAKQTRASRRSPSNEAKAARDERDSSAAGHADGRVPDVRRGQFGGSGGEVGHPSGGNPPRLPHLRKPGETQRRGGDSNPRDGLSRQQHFQCCSFSHSDTSPGCHSRTRSGNWERSLALFPRGGSDAHRFGWMRFGLPRRSRTSDTRLPAARQCQQRLTPPPLYRHSANHNPDCRSDHDIRGVVRVGQDSSQPDRRRDRPDGPPSPRRTLRARRHRRQPHPVPLRR